MIKELKCRFACRYMCCEYLYRGVGEHCVCVEIDQVSHFVLVQSVGKVLPVNVDTQVLLLPVCEQGLSTVRNEGGQVTLG